MHALSARYEVQRWKGGATVWRFEILRHGVVVKQVKTHDFTIAQKVFRYLSAADIEHSAIAHGDVE